MALFLVLILSFLAHYALPFIVAYIRNRDITMLGAFGYMVLNAIFAWLGAIITASIMPSILRSMHKGDGKFECCGLFDAGTGILILMVSALVYIFCYVLFTFITSSLGTELSSGDKSTA